MDIIIQSLGFKASEHLEDHIKEKLGKLKPNDNIVRANVTLFKGPEKAVQNDYCEIRLEVPGNDHFIKEHSADFEHAVDTAVDTLQSILRKTNEKIRDRWQKGTPDEVLVE
jgi:putative sigma-54 modulation protein